MIASIIMRAYKWPGASIVIALGLLSSSAALLFSAAPTSLVSIFIFATIVTMLTVARIGLAPYALLCIFSGLLIGFETSDWRLGLTSALACALMLFATNYAVQLVIDHSNERAVLFKLRKEISINNFAKKAVSFWIPTVALVLIGLYLNYNFQNLLLEMIYKSDLIEKSPQDSTPSGYNLEPDIFYTIDRQERRSTAKFIEGLANSSALASNAAATFPDVVRGETERFRPGDIDEGRACSGAGFRIIGKHISLGGLCRSIIAAIEDGTQSAFNRAQANAVSRARAKADKFNADGKVAAAEARAAGPELIGEFFTDIRSTAKYTFLLFAILSYASYVLLVAGIIGGLNLVLGRLLFDSTLSPRTGPRTALGFRLESTSSPPAPLQYKSYNEIDLTTLALRHDQVPEWYVVFQAMRVGTGTHMRTCIPCPSSLFFSRFATGRYLMTKITVDTDNPAVQNPAISSSGDLKLVCIELETDQEVVFKVADLLAFSSAITLKSIYTAHVATHLLGLGSFYATARGPGYLILTSEGQQVRALSRGLSVPPVSLLCWDRRTEFTLGQEVSFSGMWLNDPSVVGNSIAGTAIIDEGRSSGPGLLRHVWRVTRYLFMPF